MNCLGAGGCDLVTDLQRPQRRLAEALCCKHCLCSDVSLDTEKCSNGLESRGKESYKCVVTPDLPDNLRHFANH